MRERDAEGRCRACQRETYERRREQVGGGGGGGEKREAEDRGGAAGRKSKDKKMLKDSRLTRTHREEKRKRMNHKAGTEEKWLQLCAMRVYVLYIRGLYTVHCALVLVTFA